MLDQQNQRDVVEAAIHAMRTCFGDCTDVPSNLLEASRNMASPFRCFGGRVFPDGTKWCALLGDDIMSGVCGFGDTPAEAVQEFDRAWQWGKTPEAARNTNV